MWVVFYLIQFIFILPSIVHCFFNEPWEEAVSVAITLPTQINPIEQNTAVHSDLYTDLGDEELKITIPMDYFEAEQEDDFQRFWNHDATTEQIRYHDILINATICGSYQANAHWELKELFLYGKYSFPHNKTLAWHHLEQFNKLTRGQNSSALFELSVMHSTGLFGAIQINTGRALMLLERAAKLGDLRAKQALAYRYLKGINVPKDLFKASVIYGEISDTFRNRYTDEQWNFMFPNIDSYHVGIPHLQEGTNMEPYKRLRGVRGYPMRSKRSKPPEIESLISTNGQVVIQSNSLVINEDEDEDDKIVDIFYAALNAHQGTYTTHRAYDQSLRLLELATQIYGPQIENMDELQKIYYARCLQLLGHIYLHGEGVPANVTRAELLISQGINKTDEIVSREALIELASIKQYIHGEIEEAYRIYEIFYRSSGFGYASFQLSKLTPKFVPSKEKVTDKEKFMFYSQLKGHIPGIYEYGKILESGYGPTSKKALKSDYSRINRKIISAIASLYKRFIERNEQFIGDSLKEAFLNLLRGETEIALWNYAIAAEQGFGLAQISAGWLLCQPPRNFEEPPLIPDSRKLMALSYYQKAFDQDNPDAGLIAADIYFDMGDYEKALRLYQQRQVLSSPQAIWNVGYMFEYGLGVEKDYHLAKRYYEGAQTYLPELSFGIQICNWKLMLKMLMETIMGKTDKSSIKRSSHVEELIIMGKNSFISEAFIPRLINRSKQLLRHLFGSTSNDSSNVEVRRTSIS